VPAAGTEAKVSFPRLTFRLVALWMRTDEDQPGDVFEAAIVYHIPDSPHGPLVAGVAEFSFTTTFHRLTAQEMLVPDFFGPGLFRVECRIRRKGGAGEWVSQDFPILLEFPEGATSPITEAKP
jgi:hypothetical protein